MKLYKKKKKSSNTIIKYTTVIHGLCCFISESGSVSPVEFQQSHEDNLMSPGAATSLSTADQQEVVCQLCSTMFFSVKSYHKHLSSCHPESLPYSCDVCGKGFHSRGGQHYHMQAHKGRMFACSICNSRFKLKHHLKRHLKTVHKLAQCGKCFAAFTSSSEYNKHLAICI